MINDKWQMIEELSANSSKTGSLLIDLMDRYNVTCLYVLTEKQVADFYKEWKAGVKNDRRTNGN